MGKLHLPLIDFEAEKRNCLADNGKTLENLIKTFQDVNEENFENSEVYKIVQFLLRPEYFLTKDYENLPNLCHFVRQLLSGDVSGDLGLFTALLRAYDYSERCGVVWTYNYYAYRCRTCGLSVSMSLCEDCFMAGNHKGHDYNKFRSCAGGACDCGDVNVLSSDGFCPHHGPDKASCRPSPPPGLKFRMRALLRPLLEGLMVCLWSMAGPHFFTVADDIESPITTAQGLENPPVPSLRQSAFPPSHSWTFHATGSRHSGNTSMQSSSLEQRSVYYMAKDMFSVDEHCDAWKSLHCVFDLLQQLHAMGWLAQDVISSILLNKEDFQQFKLIHENSVVYKLYLNAMSLFKDIIQRKVMPADNLEHKCLMDTYIFSLLPLNFPEELTVLLIGLLTIAEYKYAFMYSFVDHYSRIAMLLLKHYHEPKMFEYYTMPCPIVMKDRIVHISVQLFSGENLAYELVEKRRLHYIIASCLLVCLDDCCKYLSQHRVISLNKKFLYDTGFWPMVSDFINIVSHESVVYYMCQDDRFLQFWFQIVKRLQYSDLYHRRESHIQRERVDRAKYLTSYTLELELSDNTMWNMWVHLVKPHNAEACERYFKNLLAVIYRHLMQFNGQKLLFQTYFRSPGSMPISPAPTETAGNTQFLDVPEIFPENDTDSLSEEEPMDLEDNVPLLDTDVNDFVFVNATPLNEEVPTGTALFFTLQQASLLGENDGNEESHSTTHGTGELASSSTYAWHDVLSFHLPLFRQAALFWSVLHTWHGISINTLQQMFINCFHGGVATGMTEVVSFNELMEIWLKFVSRAMLGAAEVSSNIWVYNGLEIKRTLLFYRDARYSHSLSDLDILGVQMLASCLPSSRVLSVLRHGRCLLYGFDWEPLFYTNTLDLAIEKSIDVLQSWLFTVALVLDTRTFWTKSEKGGCIRKELICCLASRSRKRSDLSDRMPELPGLNQPFGMESDPSADSLLNDVATYTAPYHDKHTGALHSGVYSIKPSVLVHEFDALFQLMRNPERREYSLALQNFFKACTQELKIENTNNLWAPLHLPPPFPPGMQGLEDILLEDSLFSMLFRILFWYLHPSFNLVTDESLNYVVHLLRRCIFRGMEKADIIAQCTGAKQILWSQHPLRFLSRKRHIGASEALPRLAQQSKSSHDERDKESICSLLIKTHACLHSLVAKPKFTSETVIAYRAPCSLGRCTGPPVSRVPYQQFQSHFIGTGAQHVSRLLDLMYWSHEELANRICKSLVYLGIPEYDVYHGLIEDKQTASNLLEPSRSPHSPSMQSGSTTPAASSTPSALVEVSASQDKEMELKKQQAKERQQKILERMAEKQRQFALKIADQRTETTEEDKPIKFNRSASEVEKEYKCIVTCAICQVDENVAQKDFKDEIHVLSRRFINSFFDLYRSDQDTRELSNAFLSNIQSAPPMDTRLWRILHLIGTHRYLSSFESYKGETMEVDIKARSSFPPLQQLLSLGNATFQSGAAEGPSPRALQAPASSASGFTGSITKQLLQRATETSRLREALHRVAPMSTLTEAGSLNSVNQEMLPSTATSHVLPQLSTVKDGLLHPGSALSGMFPHVRTHAVWYNCGHYAHAACFQRYQAHVLHQTRQNAMQQDHRHLDLVCPLCRRPVTWNSTMAEMPLVCHPIEVIWWTCKKWGAPHPSDNLSKFTLYSPGDLRPTTCDVFEAHFLAIRPIVQQVERELTCILLYPEELSRIQKQCSWLELINGGCHTLAQFLNKNCEKFPFISILYALDSRDPGHLSDLMNTFVPGTSLLSLDPVDVLILSLTCDIPCKRTLYRSLERSYSLAVLRSLYVILLQLPSADRQMWIKRRTLEHLSNLEVLTIKILEMMETREAPSSNVDTSDGEEISGTMDAIQNYLQFLLLRLLRVAAQCLSHGRWYPHWCDYFDDAKYLPDSSSIQVANLPLSLTEKRSCDWREEPPLCGEKLLRDVIDKDIVRQEFAYLVSYLRVTNNDLYVGDGVLVDPLDIGIVDMQRLVAQLPTLVGPLLEFDKKEVLMCLSIGSELFPPRLVTLPATFDEIFLPLHRLLCPRSKHPAPEYSFLCLHCGHLVCSVCTVQCANIQEEDQPLAEIFQHAIDCCGHWGVYLDISTSIVWAVHAGEVARWGAVHLDAFGEEDISLLRGKPLYLNQARYSLLEKQWICNDFRNILKYWSPQIPTLSHPLYA